MQKKNKIVEEMTVHITDRHKNGKVVKKLVITRNEVVNAMKNLEPEKLGEYDAHYHGLYVICKNGKMYGAKKAIVKAIEKRYNYTTYEFTSVQFILQRLGFDVRKDENGVMKGDTV